MIKNGRVEIGKSPAVDSAKPCKAIVDGEPVSGDHTLEKSIEKSARLLDPDTTSGNNDERQ